MFNIFIKFIITVIFFVCRINASISIRTAEPDLITFVAIDFKLEHGEHFTAPIGKGKDLAPIILFDKCKILDIFWPTPEPILDDKGEKTEYKGFTKNFSVLCKIKMQQVQSNLKYNISYVKCSKVCAPKNEKGIIQFNKLLSKNEIDSIINNRDSKNNFEKNEAKLIKQNITNIKEKQNIFYILILGFIGGILLNIMPCVFPLIGIKMLSIIKMANKNISEIRKQSLLYSCGSIGTFLFIGLIISALRSSNPSIGWGFYMQNPKFNFCLLIIFLLCALNFLEIFQINIYIPRKMQLKNINSISSGIISAVSAAICVGPFLGVVVGSALLSSNIWHSIILLLSISIGLTSPFLIFTINPKFVNKLPKLSGHSIKLFTVILGTLMFLSCAWIIFIIWDQINIPLNRLLILFIIILIAMSLYISRLFIEYINIKKIIMCFCCLFIYIGFTLTEQKNTILWEEFSDESFKHYNNCTLQPIFLNFTASWCLNCQVNSRVFEDKEIINLFKDKNIKTIKFDWTNKNEDITRILKNFGVASIPFYVYYPGNNKEYIILPSILTKSALKEAING